MEVNVHETLNTLQYACRARAIKNNVVVNVASDDDTHAVLRDIQAGLINAMRSQIAMLEVL
jgi:hypothetical protein